MYTFVTGGHRSGRTNYALRRASELGPPPWHYVTGGEEPDDAIRKRLQRSRRDEDAIWRTSVMPVHLGDLLTPKALAGVGALVLDGFTAWLAERQKTIPPAGDPAFLDEIGALAERLYRATTPVVVVSREMGLGMQPASQDGQRFLKVASSANQILASMAGAVVMMVSGVPLKVR